ncbi:mannosyltransferase [Gaetbulibacter aquiaggeris]|uniref:Mannosyltransferase n=1 Tax=Gaetbulibacter aquiaggeris TaxID=1735373 RepID=A0ABW7MMG3_9FLAO
MFYKFIKLNAQNFTFLAVLAFSFRFLFLFSIPNLSQDFYRFIWDGRMILEGFNPYLYTPESFIINGVSPVYQAQELYNGMGILNASHFTNYPPLNQLCFVIAGLFAGKSILGSTIVLRLIIIAADFGTLYFGKKLLEKLNIPVNAIFWYLLNPFIIIELTGNLHFESVMIFFLIWSLYLFQVGKWRYAAFALACSISIKLIPLIFLPLFFNWFFKTNIITHNWRSHFFELKSLFIFYSIILLISIVLFIPFYNLDFLINYAQTVALWFQDFEFNASIYYIARFIGYLLTGYNEISIIGKAIPLIIIFFVFYASFFRNNKSLKALITNMLIVLSFYYFMSTTVHPWYIATLLILSIFSNYKFPLVWSFTAILSYLAYANSNNAENLWIIGLEYTIVYGFLIWEVFTKKATKLVALNSKPEKS